MWLGIWVLSVPGLRSARAFAFFAAWFLAIAGMVNGIVHPLLAIFVGVYFPGLVSSPFIGDGSNSAGRRDQGATVKGHKGTRNIVYDGRCGRQNSRRLH